MGQRVFAFIALVIHCAAAWGQDVAWSNFHHGTYTPPVPRIGCENNGSIGQLVEPKRNLAPTPGGDVVVGCTAPSSNTNNIVTVKYHGTSGEVVWVAVHAGDSASAGQTGGAAGHAVAVDGMGTSS